VNKALDVCFDQGQVRRKLELWLNGQSLVDPVFQVYLNELKINFSNKSYSRDNRLNEN